MRETGYAANTAGPHSRWSSSKKWWATASPSWWSGSPRTAPYPGIAALVDALNAAGVQCAVFSNKADPLCGKIIAHYFGTGRFRMVRGSRPGIPTKPDPTGVYALMRDLHADPASTLFVGDSDVDILTGHNAGLPAMGALWGFRGRAELTAAGADALAAVPDDILTYVKNH